MVIPRKDFATAESARTGQLPPSQEGPKKGLGLEHDSETNATANIWLDRHWKVSTLTGWCHECSLESPSGWTRRGLVARPVGGHGEAWMIELRSMKNGSILRNFRSELNIQVSAAADTIPNSCWGWQVASFSSGGHQMRETVLFEGCSSRAESTSFQDSGFFWSQHRRWNHDAHKAYSPTSDQHVILHISCVAASPFILSVPHPTHCLGASPRCSCPRIIHRRWLQPCLVTEASSLLCKTMCADGLIPIKVLSLFCQSPKRGGTAFNAKMRILALAPCACSLPFFPHTVRYTFTVMLCYHLFTVYLATFNLGLLSHVAMSCLSAAFSWPTWTPTFCWEDEVRARFHFLWTANQTKMFWEEFFIFQQEKTHRFLHLYYMLRNAGMRGWVRKLTLEFQNQFLFPDLGFPLARSLGLKGVIHGAHLGGFKQKWKLYVIFGD